MAHDLLSAGKNFPSNAMKTTTLFLYVTLFLTASQLQAQVDTSYIYGPRFGDNNLDIRIYINQNNYYYLEEGKTFSFRAVNGVPTDTYQPMAGFNSSQYTQGHLRRKNGVNTSQFIMNYRLLFPKNYDEEYAEGYPLIVMIHGYGERGNCWDNNCYWSTPSWNPISNNPPAPTATTGTAANLLNNDHNLLHGGKPHLDAVNLANGKLPNDPSLHPRAFPGFVLFPQNLNGWGRNQPHNLYDAIRLIRLVIKEYNIDPNRIYIHGLSDGGGGTYSIIRRAPWLFAATLTMSAVNDGGLNYYNLIPEVASIPMWTFQGGTDTNPTPAKTKGFVNNFRNAGLNVRYTVYPTLGHGTWNAAYSEADFFTWILEKNKSNPQIMYGREFICETSGTGVQMVFAPGFFGYQWEKDGQIIQGANDYTYTATEPGVYRGRFSRVPNPDTDDWNRWSDPIVIDERAPVKPSITAEYSTIFPNINNDNNVAVHTDIVSDLKYRWYKNGTPINFSFTAEDDTVSSFTINNSSAFGSADYTVKTVEGGCESPLSDPLPVRYGTTETLAAPSNFAGVSTSPGSVLLSWTDNSSGEKGFEIWRRKGTTGKFTFVTLTPPDAISWHDKGLEPNTAWHYKIRTVTSNSRSPHAPGNSTGTNLVVTTPADNTAPGAPQNLSVTGNSLSSITLSWEAANDNTGIKRYVVYYGSDSVVTTSNATSYTLSGLQENSQYVITIRAEDFAGHLSLPSNQVLGTTFLEGLDYEHSTGSWNSLTAINWNMAEFRGKVTNFTLAPRTQEDFFNFKFDGYLFLPANRKYQFRTTSDDGSMMFLDGFNPNDLTQHRVVNNDGLHGNVTVESAELVLTTGAHRVVVLFFENGGGQSLTVQYRMRNADDTAWEVNWTNIPDAMLRSGIFTPPVSPAAPANLSTTGTGPSTINLSWQYGGPGTDQFEVYRSTAQHGAYEIVGRVTDTFYADAGLLPLTTYYYKLKTITSDGASSGFSATVSVKTWTDTQAPSVPTNLTLRNKNQSSIVFTWSPSSDNVALAGYEVYVDSQLEGVVDIPGFTLHDLAPNTTYALTVKAFDYGGHRSAASSALMVTTDPGSGLMAFSATMQDAGLTSQEENASGETSAIAFTYPNPVGTEFFVQLNTLDNAAHIRLTDLTGQKTYIDEMGRSEGNGVIRAVLPQYINSGIYMLTVTVGGKQIRQRIMVAR